MTNANDNETVQERIYRIMRSKKMQQSLVAKDAGFCAQRLQQYVERSQADQTGAYCTTLQSSLASPQMSYSDFRPTLHKNKREVKTTCRDQIEISQSIHAFLISRHQE